MSGRGPRLIALALAATLAGLAIPAVPAAADPLPPLPAPSQPVASQITSTGAVLTWASGGGPVFRFSMKRLVDGEWQGYASMPTASLTLAALTPDTEYTFAVQAAPLAGSGYGMSPLSEPVTFRTQAANFTCQIRISAGNGFFTLTGTVPWTGALPAPWQVTFTIEQQLSITQVWNANFSRSGTQAWFSGGSWGAPPPAGTPIGFGANGSYTGTFTPPRDFRFNGVTCEVTVTLW